MMPFGTWLCIFIPKSNVSNNYKKSPGFTVTRENTVIDIQVPMVKNSDWEQYVFCISDQHFDSTHCDRQMLIHDLETVVKRNAIILSYGDWFDAICGRGDPRSTKSELRPEYKKSDYFMAVIEDSVNALRRYAPYFAVISHGNHETSVIKNSEIDPTKMLVTRLKHESKTQCIQGEYEEFVRLSFFPPKNKKVAEQRYSRMFYLNHGWGGASPVTGGTIHNARISEYVKADFVCMGHLHTSQIDERVYWEPNNYGNVIEKSTHYIRTAGYKTGRMPGRTTWETVKGIKPKPRGGIWIRFYYDNSLHTVKCDIIKPT